MIGRPQAPALWVGLLIALVALVVGLGLWRVGSPSEQRHLNLDQKRVRDLREINASVDQFWKKQDSMPASLAELAEWKGRDETWADPETDEPYVYQPTGDRAYRLCATFALESTKPLPRQPFDQGPSVWHHPAGETCFDLAAEVEDP